MDLTQVFKQSKEKFGEAISYSVIKDGKGINSDTVLEAESHEATNMVNSKEIIEHEKVSEEVVLRKKKKLRKESQKLDVEESLCGDSLRDSDISQTEAENKEKDQRTIFVGNVSLETTNSMVKKHFHDCGEIESIRIRSVPVTGCRVNQHGNQNLVKKVCVNQKKFVEGLETCNAYVVFKSAESINRALKLNNSVLCEKRIVVDYSMPIIDHKRSVFVGNLPYDVSVEKLRVHFVKNMRGKDDIIEKIRVIRDPETGIGKGFGYILFKDISLAAQALDLNEKNFGKRQLRVLICGKRFKGRRGKFNIDSKKESNRSFEGSRASGALRRLSKKKSKVIEKAKTKTKSVKKPKHMARKLAKLMHKENNDGKHEAGKTQINEASAPKENKKSSKKRVPNKCDNSNQVEVDNKKKSKKKKEELSILNGSSENNEIIGKQTKRLSKKKISTKKASIRKAASNNAKPNK